MDCPSMARIYISRPNAPGLTAQTFIKRNVPKCRSVGIVLCGSNSPVHPPFSPLQGGKCDTCSRRVHANQSRFPLLSLVSWVGSIRMEFLDVPAMSLPYQTMTVAVYVRMGVASIRPIQSWTVKRKVISALLASPHEGREDPFMVFLFRD